MPQIGPLELMVVAVIALVVFGPRRLPEMARSVGKALNEFKRQAADLKGQFDAADLLDEPVSADAPPGPGTVVPEPTGAVGAVEVAPEPEADPVVDESSTRPIQTTNQ